MKPIWIVDDDQSIRFVLEKALLRESLPTRSFTNPREVLDALADDQDEGPQVLVSDIRMPGGSGLDLLERVKKIAPPSTQLAITIALEHYTALLADWVLSVDSVTRDAEPGYQALWRWHSMEETEHKAVAYDVWNAVMKDKPRAYIERAAVQLVATSLFMLLVAVYTVRMSRANPKARGLGQWRELASFLIGREGFLRRSFRPWLDYFKPGFHPWQHDNRHFLAEIDGFVREHGRLAAAA